VILCGMSGTATRAQQACSNITGTLAQRQINYGSGSIWIASETDTYNVACNQTETGVVYYTATNAATATGGGGYSPKDGSSNHACNPTFSINRSVTTNYPGQDAFSNFARDNTFDPPSGTCSPGLLHTTITYCATRACKTCNPKLEQCQGSPLIIDTTGDGFHLTSYADGVRFDLAGTGKPKQMAWTTAGTSDAFLALPGADGLVHDGKHLFGNFTSQPSSDHPNGFIALAVYDDPKNGGNGDGIIDSRDAVFASLRLWIDANHDGICQPNEMHTLPSLGVNSISLKYHEDDKTDQYGNQFRYRARLNPDKPTEANKTVYDVFFVASDPSAANRLAKPATVSCANPGSVGMLATPNSAPLSK
jgi:hypothetical protein